MTNFDFILRALLAVVGTFQISFNFTSAEDYCPNDQVKVSGAPNIECSETCFGSHYVCSREYLMSSPGNPICRCPRGYIYYSRYVRACVPKEMCDKARNCNNDQEALKCPSKCQPTCANRYPDYSKCESGCHQTLACDCPEGRVRISDTDTKCVLVKECDEKLDRTLGQDATSKCDGGKIWTKDYEFCGLCEYPFSTCMKMTPTKESCQCPKYQVENFSGKCVNYLECLTNNFKNVILTEPTS